MRVPNESCAQDEKLNFIPKEKGMYLPAPIVPKRELLRLRQTYNFGLRGVFFSRVNRFLVLRRADALGDFKVLGPLCLT